MLPDPQYTASDILIAIVEQHSFRAEIRYEQNIEPVPFKNIVGESEQADVTVDTGPVPCTVPHVGQMVGLRLQIGKQRKVVARVPRRTRKEVGCNECSIVVHS